VYFRNLEVGYTKPGGRYAIPFEVTVPEVFGVFRELFIDPEKLLELCVWTFGRSLENTSPP
jgi:hypothetical protein